MAKKKVKNWLLKKFQIVVRKKNYEIIWRFNTSTWRVIVFVFLFIVISFTASYFLIGYTPIESTLPNFPSLEQKKMMLDNYRLSDSLLKEIESRDKYFTMIRDFVLDEVPIDEEYVVSPKELSQQEIEEFNDPTVPRKEKHAQKITFKRDEIPKLLAPIDGVIANEFDAQKEHYGIDIISPKPTTIKATLSGMVILTDFTLKSGYTVIIQHNNNLVSIYKHCESIITSQGAFVDVGQAIAIYGNSGDESTGKHLHFELWKKGYPLNPSEYINL